jgi:aquaporin Z
MSVPTPIGNSQSLCWGDVADVIPYWIVQVVGAVAAAAVLYLISSGREGFSLADGFAANG